METIKEVLDKIDELGWSVYEDDTYYELSKYSPAGQDFNMTINKSDNVDEFINNIYKAYEDFDVSESASLWIGENGHGINGAPYELEDLLEDMKWCKQAIYDLWCDLTGSKKEEEINYKEKARKYLIIAYNAICLGQLDEQYDRDHLLKELGCTEEEYDEIMGE